MRNLADCSATSWVYLDPDQIRRDLEAAFPGVRAWFGEYTGHWWALVNDRLVEADTLGSSSARFARPRTGGAAPSDRSLPAPENVAALARAAEAAAARSGRGLAVKARVPQMYAWDVEDGQANVTDDMDAAITNVDLALRGAATGVCGAIRVVTVSMYGNSEYIDLGVVGKARRDEGGVVDEAVRPPGEDGHEGVLLRPGEL